MQEGYRPARGLKNQPSVAKVMGRDPGKRGTCRKRGQKGGQGEGIGNRTRPGSQKSDQKAKGGERGKRIRRHMPVEISMHAVKKTSENCSTSEKMLDERGDYLRLS